MMDNGQPDPKRPRIGPGPGSWPIEQPNQPNHSRALPPPLQPPYNSSPFSRSDPHSNPLDRRPPPHSNYQEHTDPHRPNSGHSHVYHNIHNPHPAIPPFNGHNGHNAPRDPMVKPEVADEPPQHRPPPTTNGSDHHVNAPYDDRGRPYPPKFDQAPPSQPHYPMYPPQPPPPSTSPMTTPTYDGPVPMYGPPSHQPPPREQYPVAQYAQPSKPRKAQRAAQACDSCRNLKAKCDEGRPSCGSCKEKSFECHYRDPPPKPIDKASTDIIEGLLRLQNRTEDLFKMLSDGLKGLNDKVERMQDAKANFLVQPITRTMSGSVMKKEASDRLSLANLDTSFHGTVDMMDPPTLPHASPFTPAPVEPPPADVISTPGEEEEEEENGEIVTPGQALIPVNHTTGAARLLLVGAIRRMIEGGGGFPRRGKDEKYPMLQEERRGLLRLFGRGEGTDLAQGYDRDPLIDHGADATAPTEPDVPSPPGEEWGQLGGMTPPHSAPDYPPPVVGSIMSDGMPDFRRATVLDLAKSYKEHINIMHPLLAPARLDALIESFLKSIPGDSAKPKQIQNLTSQHAGFVNMKPPESPGAKRKRSPGAELPDIPYGHGALKPGHPSRSISTALVLVVLALGKICQEKGKIPELPSDKESDSAWGHINSPLIRNGHPSPVQSSPSLSDLASPQEGPDRFYSRSRRTSMEYSDPLPRSGFKPRNVDVIPGLAYFALATDIIGNQLAGNSLQHVHVNILAGLYHGQLARVLESHSYIYQACRALQVILRPKLDRFKKLKESNGIVPVKDNPLIVAFWSCLQLESDIVAELPCPHSGILAYEEDMPSPNLTDAINIEGFEYNVFLNYSHQLYARKHLNQLHNMFYKPDNDSQFPSVYVGKEPKHFMTIEAVEANIQFLMTWKEDDPLPTNILDARMRAKFFGAEVITYRHFVLKILEHSEARSRNMEPATDEFRENVRVTSINKNDRTDEIHPQALIYAKRGLKALIQSTTAFHGLGEGRLIVTNVWGTAHAQWGNMLVLQAAWNDDILRPLFDGLLTQAELARLLERTLRFLGLVATRSSALYTDIKILVNAGKFTGLLDSSAQARNYLHSSQGYTSFSSSLS
ncbi:hypothetical protein ACMFMF_005877 [Clarireedia jacksonii]